MTVHLRPLSREDADRVLAWRNSPEVARWMYGDGDIAPADHARWIDAVLAAREAAEPDRLYWIVEVNGAGVGVANLVRIDRDAGTCDWAYYLADPAVRGRGVGSAVEYAVLSQVFGALGLERLACEVFVENSAVIALHEAFGFRRQCLLRAHVVKAGEDRDVVRLALSSADWREAEPAARARMIAKGYDPASITVG
ncbi:UDP-4-amino-4,6-dideoxy-N-acetyl-beta-L-altrosamine N-acetyltransferase [soil metagenome]